jgi:hypothetical protein
MAKYYFISELARSGKPMAVDLFNILACLREYEGVRLQVVA